MLHQQQHSQGLNVEKINHGDVNVPRTLRAGKEKADVKKMKTVHLIFYVEIVTAESLIQMLHLLLIVVIGQA